MNSVKYTTDILIFAIDSRKNENIRELPEKHFSILLVKRNKEPFKDHWCLPGGYVYDDETSFGATKRILKKETNLSNVYVEQLGVFDTLNRDPRGKTVSIAYMSLIDKSKVKSRLSDNAKWFDIKLTETDKKNKIKLSNDEEIEININKKIINVAAEQIEYILFDCNNIAFDHGLIINNGIMQLRKKASNTDIIFNLMNDNFTIGELKQVYEIILGKKLINSAFRRVIGPKIKPVDEIIKTGGHRPSQKYTYKNN